MFPVLIEIGTYKVHSYGFFIAVGYVSALLLGRYLAKARSLDPGPFMDLAFIAIVSGVVGARLLFVITAAPQQLRSPLEILDFWNGGLVFYGGFILATLACLAFGYLKKMPIRLSTDIVVTGVAFAHAFGRVGCFAAGCCYGSVCPYPWGITNNTTFAPAHLHATHLHPVQLYEAVALFLLTGILVHFVRGKKLADGMPALLYLAGYAAIRFFVEFFRGDDDRGFVLGPLSTSQAIALALLCLSGWLFIRGFRRKHL